MDRWATVKNTAFLTRKVPEGVPLMKRIFTIFTLAAAIFAGSFLMNTNAQNAQSAKGAAGLYRHVVCFKFKDSAKPEQVEAIVKDFAALKEKIPAIQSFEWGKQCSPENHAMGLTHVFTLTFADKKAIEGDGYLTHPEHKKFGASLGPILDKVVVVDYVVE